MLLEEVLEHNEVRYRAPCHCGSWCAEGAEQLRDAESWNFGNVVEGDWRKQTESSNEPATGIFDIIACYF